MDEHENEVEISLDPIDAALVEAEAKSRGVTVDHVIREKFNEGLMRAFPFFDAPDRPSKGQHRH